MFALNKTCKPGKFELNLTGSYENLQKILIYTIIK